MTRLEISIDIKIADFDQRLRNLFRHALASFLEIPTKCVTLNEIREGSVQVLVTLPEAEAEHLVRAFEIKDAKLFEQLAPLSLLRINRATESRDRIQNMTDVTRILNAIEAGDSRAGNELLPLVYDELRLLAAQKLSHERPGQTLQATALVHEAYLRLVGDPSQEWEGQGHFFGAAAEAMRRILVESARRKGRLKRGRGHQRLELEPEELAVGGPPEDILALNEALSKLEEEEQGVFELVKLRYFAGLTLQQVAEVQGISRRTADRHWAFARAWLYQEMTEDKDP